MHRTQMIFPLAALVALTFGVGFAMLRLRMRAVRKGELRPQYFLLNRGGKPPAYLAQVEQNYLNLLELPLLFYVLGLAAYVSDAVNAWQVGLAWAFVATRIAHTLVHTRSNDLRGRRRAFLAGALVLMIAWVSFLGELLSRMV